ncbi:hypothetical protein N6H18_05105 [Reichenbachiella agarivorans]|uniref:Lipocalin-like domain-containing protein n=1 Tax=Reichenbachiella agarivorans TaxID=2979464 RepID=A0ABY6CVA6_9BACT|nr:hypothetical protein [Reichenbachiella agarivorans]UXP33328.1 hypothetical protein N6H18_05105 [Reichenbachiella agarivorans]
MKTVSNHTLVKLSLMLLIVAAWACETKKSTENQNENKKVVGNWNVQWVTYPDKNTPLDPSINLTMNGKMEIKGNGKITISAFGYDNCIFGKDTLIHTLNWEVLGDTLNVKNDGDEFGMPYLIVDYGEDKMKLQLVEDVYLFLTKV